MGQHIATVRADRFALAHAFTAVYTAEDYLTGVRIDPAGVGAVLIGTDGHNLGAVHDIEAIADHAITVSFASEPYDAPYADDAVSDAPLLPAADAWGAGTWLLVESSSDDPLGSRARGMAWLIEGASAEVVNAGGGRTLWCGLCTLREKFFDWRRTVGAPRAGAASPLLLAGTALRKFGAAGAPLRVTPQEPGKPYLITATRNDFIGLMMPPSATALPVQSLRADADGNIALPHWWHAPAALAVGP